MPEPESVAEDLPLRERKKLRTRQALTETALRLFLDRGFHQTTLDDLVAAVDVSKRTFFRMYSSKDDVALAAEHELWDAYLDQLKATPIDGLALDYLRTSLITAIRDRDDDWDRRFVATRGLLARTPELWDRSLVLSVQVQARVVEELERQLDVDSAGDVRLRLLGELSLAAWRCAARNWIAGRGQSGPGPRQKLGRWRGPGGRAGLINSVEQAYAAIPASIQFAI